MFSNKKSRKVKFFIEHRKLLGIWGILSLSAIIIYLITFNMQPVGNLSVEFANSIWNIIISLSTGYLISLMFYIMLVFETEYIEYEKKINIAKRVYNYYLRMDNSISDMFSVLSDCSKCKDIQDFINSSIEYRRIKNDVIQFGIEEYNGLTCEVALKKYVREVNENLNRIEPYLTYLNGYATDLFVKVQQTYIFENVDKEGEWFDLSISMFLNNLVDVQKEFTLLRKNGFISII